LITGSHGRKLVTVPTVINYHEEAEVENRRLAKTGGKPLYAFGHGLSYTGFSYGDLDVTGGDTVTNTGDRAGRNPILQPACLQNADDASAGNRQCAFIPRPACLAAAK